MNDSRHEDLLQGRLDGALGPGEAAELQAALDGSAEMRERAAELDQLSALLEES